VTGRSADLIKGLCQFSLEQVEEEGMWQSATKVAMTYSHYNGSGGDY